MALQHSKHLDLFDAKFRVKINQANYNKVIHIHGSSDYFFIIVNIDNLQKIFHSFMYQSEYFFQCRHLFLII